MIAPPGIPNITSTPSASRERRIASAPFIFIFCPSVSRCLVPSPVAGCDRNCLRRVLHWGYRCVGDVSLAGENVDELDAYAVRRRVAVKGGERIAVERGAGVAEHRLQSMPDRVRGRKPEASAAAVPTRFRPAKPGRIDDARIA